MGGNTTVFKYDKGGNLQYKKVYAYSAASGNTYNELLSGTSGKTKNYGYAVSGNKDTLTSYNGSGMLEYDDYGNPKKWLKHGTDGSSLGYSLSWGHVSNLTAITDDADGTTYTYKYNDQGIRTEKAVNGVVHKYYLQGEQIIAERYGNNLIKFYYDTTGVCGFNYNGTDYYYQKNIQGDILRIFDKNGNLKAEYSYDAWGKCTIKSNVSNIAAINPFRYRGYYFDSEIGLYYLNARYYDPEIGRFISPDSVGYLDPEGINGLNIFAYCNNNPIINSDLLGCFWDFIFDAIFLIWSIVDVIQNPTSWQNWVALGIDVVFAVLPFVPAAGGQAIKLGGRIDNMFDLASSMNKLDNLYDLSKITVIGETMNRVRQVGRTYNVLDNLYDGFSLYDKLAAKGKIGTIFAEIGGKLSNAGWLFNKLRKGYTILDIGIDAVRTVRSSSYKLEKVILMLWKTRNIWKIPVNSLL